MSTLREKEEAEHFNTGVVLGAVGVSFIWLLGLGLFAAASSKRYNNLQAEAVQHGSAEWVANDYGSTEFRWKNENDTSSKSTD